MSESKLKTLSMDFAVDIVNLIRDLRPKHENIITNQIGRSGTSIGANIHEANYAQGKKDLFLNLKSPSKKQVKQAIGSNFYIEQTILIMCSSNHFQINRARQE